MKIFSALARVAPVVPSSAVALCMAALFAVPAVAQTNQTDGARTFRVHAVPDGSGTACSQRQPCGLIAAQRRVRTILAHSSKPTDVTVVLATGMYRLTAPLQFGPRDSGAPGHPVRWLAAKGARPVISGAVRITGWKLADKVKDIWAAPVPPAADTRQLYVNGKEVSVASTTPKAQHVTFAATKGGYTVAPSSWARALTKKVNTVDLKRIEFVFPAANGAWTQSFCRVASIRGDTVLMQQPCWRNVTHRTHFRDATGGLPAMPRGRAPGQIRNAYPFLQPGQWYLDKADNVLYYRLDKGQSIGKLDIEMPRLQTLVEGKGQSGDPVHDLSFSGITFAYATWLGPSSDAGFADVQDNLRLTHGPDLPPQGMCAFSVPRGSCPFGSLTREPGNVSWSHASRIALVNDTFIHLGAAGVVFDRGSKKNIIEGSLFTDISGNAIILGNTMHPHPKKGFINAGNKITNNLIHDIGTDYPSAAAITLFFSRHTVVAHNDIYDVPYTGISDGVIQGHVDNAVHPDNTTNVNADNQISHNLIHAFMQDLHDGGAIYIEGRQGPGGSAPGSAKRWRQYLRHGLLVEGNVAYDQGHANFTWYDDAGAQWIRFRSNVEWGSGKHGGHGGCQPAGNISYARNYGSHRIGKWACTPPVPVHVVFRDNAALPVYPALGDLPLRVIRQAGPVGRFRSLAASVQPRVSHVQVSRGFGAQAGARILVTGAGFVDGATRVRVSRGAPTAAQVLNDGMLSVAAPAGVNPCPLTVTTPTGSAVGKCSAHPVQFWTKSASGD